MHENAMLSLAELDGEAIEAVPERNLMALVNFNLVLPNINVTTQAATATAVAVAAGTGDQYSSALALATNIANLFS